MSDEEKKAIANLKTEYEKLIKEDNIFFPLYKNDAKRLINLIKKQQKEIEELKIIADKYEDLKIFYEDNICELEKQSREIKKLREKLEFLNKEKRKKYENRR